MEAETSKDLVLYFERSDGKSYSVSIPDYLEGITDEQIKATNAVRIDTTKTEVPLETE